MPAATAYNEWDLPRLKASIGFEDDFQYLMFPKDEGDTEFFDVKFYPYAEDDDECPVFAAVSTKHVVIYRLNPAENPPYQLLQLIRDDDADALNCACTWTKDPETETPYLCVAGRDAKVKVYDVVNGKLVNTLVGHGGEINDLATSPTNFLIIASASDDTTVRLWSLDPADAEQPCICILGGEGHLSHLLTVAFHQSGKYMLSAGHDNVVCLWTLPDLGTRDRSKTPPPPFVVHYPHFSTSEVHSGIVDCVRFFGDLVLSRACHEEIIVLWRIEGFSSDDPPPSPSSAPTSTSDMTRLTRSAFTPNTSSASAAQYTRLLEFYTPGCGSQFYLRFNLHYAADQHPVLAFCNAHAAVFFWDLERLIGYDEWLRAARNPEYAENGTVKKPDWLQPIQHRAKNDAFSRVKDSSDRGSSYSGRTGSADVVDREQPQALSLDKMYSAETLESWHFKYQMEDKSLPIKAHAVSSLNIHSFVGRQVAWSGDGRWCIVVGSRNLAGILQRSARRVGKEKSK